MGRKTNGAMQPCPTCKRQRRPYVRGVCETCYRRHKRDIERGPDAQLRSQLKSVQEDLIVAEELLKAAEATLAAITGKRAQLSGNGHGSPRDWHLGRECVVLAEKYAIDYGRPLLTNPRQRLTPEDPYTLRVEPEIGTL